MCAVAPFAAQGPGCVSVSSCLSIGIALSVSLILFKSVIVKKKKKEKTGTMCLILFVLNYNSLSHLMIYLLFMN